MNTSSALSIVSPTIRVWSYLVVAVFALVVGTLDAYYGEADPDWLLGLNRAAIYLLGALGVTAATHVPASPDSQMREIAAKHAGQQGAN